MKAKNVKPGDVLWGKNRSSQVVQSMEIIFHVKETARNGGDKRETSDVIVAFDRELNDIDVYVN